MTEDVKADLLLLRLRLRQDAAPVTQESAEIPHKVRNTHACVSVCERAEHNVVLISCACE